MKDGIYVAAANVIFKYQTMKSSVRNAVFENSCKNKKKLLKLVCQTLDYFEILREIAVETKLLKLEDFEKPSVSNLQLLVQLWEYAFGQRPRNLSKSFDVIVQRDERIGKIRESLVRRKVLNEDFTVRKKNTRNDAFGLPRYARVNSLKADLALVDAELASEGWALLDAGGNLAGRSYAHDPDVSDCLVFPPSTDLHDAAPCTSGKLLLQDKSSMLAALALNPNPGAVVVESCAAPGMKTAHLAAIMGNEGRIYAFDKDETRVGIMENILQSAGVSCASVEVEDFLAVDLSKKKFRKAKFALVDPPCSGSGIQNRIGNFSSESAYQPPTSRLRKLANLQAMLLKKALSLPNVQRVVYSTCSVHKEENETVVEEALASTADFELAQILPDWPCRGSNSYTFGKMCCRASPGETRTNGFFVACLQRKP